MSLIENYAQNHVDLLKHNDYIDPALYKKYGADAACELHARYYHGSACRRHHEIHDAKHPRLFLLRPQRAG